MIIFLQIAYIAFNCLLQLDYFSLHFVASGFITFIMGLLLCWVIAYIIKYKKTSVIFAFSHQIFIIFYFYEFLKVKHDADAVFIWIVPIIIDKPVSLLFPYAISIMYKVYYLYGISAARIVPLIFFSIFGSLQYYLIGRFIEFIVSIIRNRKTPHFISMISFFGNRGRNRGTQYQLS